MCNNNYNITYNFTACRVAFGEFLLLVHVFYSFYEYFEHVFNAKAFVFLLCCLPPFDFVQIGDEQKKKNKKDEKRHPLIRIHHDRFFPLLLFSVAPRKQLQPFGQMTRLCFMGERHNSCCSLAMN